uniref:Galectin n=1 Tax=Geotrypetes seraphini TaxID=260995 RepID=A0A6P8RUS3_GEOSA|nr:galectin-3-like [Geotrypetes seraphini]
MADDLSLSDALSGNTQNSNQQQQNPGWPFAPWGPPNPGGWPAPGQPGMFPGPAPGHPGSFPGPDTGHPGSFPGPVPGHPGSFPGPAPGQPGSFPGPAPGQPGSFPGPDTGHPGSFPGPAPGHPGSFPGPAPGQPGSFPGPDPGPPGSAPGQPGVPQPPNPFGVPAGPTPQPKDPCIPLTIPYVRPLTAGVMPQLLITIQGKVKEKPSRFSIDLRKNNDIAFHLNPRFDKKPHSIVRNSMINNIWGEEERHTPKFPFHHGSPFKIQILCETHCYRVAVNNEHLFEYKHRIKELKEINKLCINGDVTLTNIEVTMA